MINLKDILKQKFLSRYLIKLEPVFKSTDLKPYMYIVDSITGERLFYENDIEGNSFIVKDELGNSRSYDIHSGKVSYVMFFAISEKSTIRPRRIHRIFKVLGDSLIKGQIAIRKPISNEDKTILYTALGHKFNLVSKRLDERVYMAEDGFTTIVNEEGEPLSLPMIFLFKRIVIK